MSLFTKNSNNEVMSDWYGLLLLMFTVVAGIVDAENGQHKVHVHCKNEQKGPWCLSKATESMVAKWGHSWDPIPAFVPQYHASSIKCQQGWREGITYPQVAISLGTECSWWKETGSYSGASLLSIKMAKYIHTLHIYLLSLFKSLRVSLIFIPVLSRYTVLHIV